jgi:hypothetical protein
MASPGRTSSITTPMVSFTRLGEWGVLATPRSADILLKQVQ